ncbi:unnamed protein product [Hymenolepis diminuta]|uniref:Adenosine 3'-phospho 5'-phosphosulfate transporter 1 n=1 Tax=Hymenolepis diminuta TaxID=6216 RepID=A0A158QCE1_HYMDI|nr:unnamed protein product [Hymenolepis diminuta]
MASNEISSHISFFEPAIKKIKPIYFCIILLVYTFCAILIQFHVYSSVQLLFTPDLWFLRLAAIVFCYTLIYIPIAVLKRIAPLLSQQWEAETSSLASICQCSIVVCFLSHLPIHQPLHDPVSSTSKSSLAARACDGLSQFTKRHRWMALVGCTLGLNFVYILWGVLQGRIINALSIEVYLCLSIYSYIHFQEKIMTRSYNGEHFREPQFLIFCNRIGALIVAVTCLALTGARSDDSTAEIKSPLTSYAHPALSNIVSSWCQYEALIFITFPIQVLFGEKRWTVALISIGVCIFILSSPPEHEVKATENSVSGLILICGYIVLDSYTSTSQSNLFRTFKMSPLHMMCGVCSWAVLFIVTPLLANETLKSSLQFAWRQPQFAFDAAASALCSGIGQVLIFATIAEFGAVTFNLIMTVRMCLSILVSCMLFSHPLNILGIGGLLITFGAIFAKMILKTSVNTSSVPNPKS